MMTSYWLTCPFPGCRWSGDLLPRNDRHFWDGAVPSTKEVAFVCPQCQGEFRGTIEGDDVVALSRLETAWID
jgi:hypothetical protein